MLSDDVAQGGNLLNLTEELTLKYRIHVMLEYIHMCLVTDFNLRVAIVCHHDMVLS